MHSFYFSSSCRSDLLQCLRNLRTTFLANLVVIAVVMTNLFTKLFWPGDSQGTFFGQETDSQGRRFQLLPAHQSTTHGGDFTMSLFAKRQAGSCEYQFLQSLV